MNISTAAGQSGLAAKTIRYYEEIGLVGPARRDNGYRDYSSDDVHRLRFIQRSRSLGFSVEDCRALLSLYEDKQRASSEVKQIAASHLAAIRTKISDLEGLAGTLEHLVNSCHGDDRPDCPIIDQLALTGTPQRKGQGS